ncbi:VOC family protein [Halegenticoccus tardaugens]|uniref:VOC family protein n=1 Tax=Halegenticoccus tardaugens TaxID=2071624 RepID=UPI00100BAE14|nr:VOC family protein [Halegenticoccus tardaugens]
MTDETPLSPRIDTVFLPVARFGTAVDWYVEVFGFDVRWRDDDAGYAAIEVGETPLTLVRDDDPSDDRDGHQRFNFFTDDIEATHETLTSRGVEVSPVEAAPGIRFFTFQDVDGNRLGFCEYEA